MEKRKVLVTVEQASDGSYWCHTEDAINLGHFNSVGRTVEEAKQDLLDCCEEAREFEDDLPEVDFIVQVRYSIILQLLFISQCVRYCPPCWHQPIAHAAIYLRCEESRRETLSTPVSLCRQD